MPQKQAVHRSAAEAWHFLHTKGGIDLAGRDREIAEKLRDLLDPRAADLAAALASVTTDRLVQCVFQVLQPYSEMFRQILEFYKKAGARHGRQQWNIAVDGAHLDLSDFEDFIQLWNDIPSELEVPAVERDDMGVHWDAWERVPSFAAFANKAGREYAATGDVAIDEWLVEYRSGRFTRVPSQLWAAQQEDGFKELATIGVAALDTILSFASSRSELKANITWDLLRHCDAFSLDQLGFLDTDHWLGSLVAGLALAGRLKTEDRARISAVLREKLQGLPVRKVNASVSFGDLLKFLSLPLWEKRHELYAVWIFTEILAAAADHDIRLFHQDGRITFEFRETLLATIDSARPRIDIVTEHRTPLLNPVGKGRSANVQPDYSLWEKHQTGERCVLVVEVKHYKRSDNRPFSEVLIDYAAAHQQAAIVLVNYGLIGDVLDRLPATIKGRCSVVEHLTAMSRAKRRHFHELVQSAIGEPVRAAMKIGTRERATAAIAVDVSRSMQPILADGRFEEYLTELAVAPFAEEIYPINDRVLEPLGVDGAATKLWLLTDHVNALSDPATLLLQTYEEIAVITDVDGLDDLKAFGGEVEWLSAIQAYKVILRRQ
ncbi:hypothetical protein [Rhizobium ruizarguesonis]|uniref:hypothetical protein n=1 Tax=Rhizobium ruizarguesonis TaxID=2081791 RepID=UPI00371B0670